MPSNSDVTSDSPSGEPSAGVQARDARRKTVGEYEYLLREQAQDGAGQGDLELAASDPTLSLHASLAEGDEFSSDVQAWLFPQDDLVLPDNVLRMRKAVAAIHAVPVKSSDSPSLNTRRIFDALILTAQMDIRRRGPEMMERIRGERVSPFFEVRITELVRLAGIKGKNYQRVYEELDEICDMKLQWNVVREDATVEWQMRAHFLSTYGRGKGAQAGLIRFSIDPAILEIVLDPANWANLSLNVLRGMPTAASYQLYQNVWRYIGTAQKVTAALPVETWIELILGPSRFVKTDDKTGKKTVVDYGDFKRRYLVDAIDRVNSTPALEHTIELKEFRSGNRVAKLQFKFHRKTQQRLELPMAWDDALVDRLRVMGFSPQEISEMSQAHTADRVTQALLALASARDRMEKAGEKMVTPKGYLEGILKRLPAGGASAGDGPQATEQEAEQQRLQQQQRREQERAQQLVEEFNQYHRECFYHAMVDGDATIVQQCRAAFEASPQFATNRFVIERFGWESTAVMGVLNNWLRANAPKLYEQLMPEPMEREFDAWLEVNQELQSPQQKP